MARDATRWTLLAAVAVVTACAGDVGEVDRVQPGYVKKADLLVGSWYYRRTIVDAPEAAGPWFTVGQGDLFTIERVRFAVQEFYVYAYRDYEYVPNSDGQGDAGAEYFGSPVAAFPVEQHFDILFEYNPETGEKTNVRAENTTDREWYEREFVRVNWAVNENPNLDFLIPLKILPGVENNGICESDDRQDSEDCKKKGGATFYVHPDEANNPWHARLRPDQGYLDFVVNHFVQPDPWTCYSQYELNDVFYNPNYCGAGEVRVRHAFTRVDDNKYAALYYPDSVTLTDAGGNEIYDPTTGEVVREPIFDRFGAYRLEKLTYDDERGLTESGRLYRAFRFDIWQQGRDANGPIPYANRQVKPIVYHLNYDFPDDLKGTAAEVAAEWNLAFQKTVASLQNLPVDNFVCSRNAGGAPIDANDPDCRLPNVFVLNENGCNLTNLRNYLAGHTGVAAATIESVTGERVSGGVVARLDQVLAPLGASEDLRHQMLDNWCSAAEYHSQNLSDPFVWQQIGDPRFTMMYWVPNIVPTGWSGYGPMLADPETGRIVTATAYIMGWTIESQATRALEYIDYINGELTLSDLLLGSNAPNVIFQSQYDPTYYTQDMQNVRHMAGGTVDAIHLQELKARLQGLGGTAAQRLTPVENSAHFAERLARIRGTEAEKAFLTRPEDLMLASRGAWKPGSPVSDELWADASFVTRVREIQGKRDKVDRYFQERTLCPIADLDDALVGLAKQLKGEPSRDARRQFLRKAIFKAVMLHEVGHNVGMRHNFAGSYDALNYPEWFWTLETAGLSAQEKLDEQQPEFMYSSVMDYHGKTNADFRGLGLYDHAFVKFMYGQLIETFNDPAVDGRELRYDQGTNLKPPTQRFKDDYTKLPQTVGSVASMFDRSDVPWDWENERVATAVQSKLANEVPYMFCSDEYANWTPSCKRFDFGANQREVQAAAQVRYKNYFLFTNFLRYRLSIDFNAVVTRGYTTFLDTVLTYHYMYLYASRDPSFLDSTDAGADMATAVGRGLNLISEVLAMPSPQYFHRCVRNPGPSQEVIYYPLWMIAGEGVWDPVVDPSVGTGPEGESCDIDAELGVPLGVGLPLFLGFSEDYITWTFTYLGTYWDKLFALTELTDPLAVFPRFNHSEDLSSFSISFYRLYPDVVNDILLGLIEYDRSAITWYYDEQGDRILPRPALALSGLVDLADDYTQLPKIVPALARNLQFFSLLFGQAFLTSPLDETLDFGKHTRVWVRGGAEDFLGDAGFASIPPANRIECTLPEAGRTFRAMRTASFDSKIDVAFTFVQRCVTRQQELVTAQAAYDQALAAAEANPSDRALWRAAEERERRFLLADFRMRDTEQEMLYMRWVNTFYEYGLDLGF